MIIRNIEPRDYRACLDIYNYYIENTEFTLEIAPHTEESFFERIRALSTSCPVFSETEPLNPKRGTSFPYIVAEEDGEIIGYAYLDRFSPREGYRFTCDIAAYLKRGNTGSGTGKLLLDELMARAKELGLRTVIAVVTDKNAVSLAFTHSYGFKEIAHLENVAEKHGQRFGVHYLRKDI